LIINAIMLYAASEIVPGFEITGFWKAFWAALLISLVSSMINFLIHKESNVTVHYVKRNI
jgi:uncharacterized membrane protein YvlD (DUF360 family)